MLYAYCRVSTSSQLEGLSMTIQGDERLLDTLAEKYKTTVSKRVYQDEGKSAYKGMHLKGELGQLLSDIDSGIVKKSDIIVVRHLDRLSRLSLTGAIDIYNRIMKAGVLIHTTMDNRLYEPEDQISLLLATLAFNTANEESAKKSFLTNKYALTRIEQFQRCEKPEDGVWDIGVGRHPFYMTIENKVVKPDPALFPLAQQAVQMALDGKGITKTLNFFNEHGFEIGYSSVSKLFNNECLFGRMKVTLDGQEFILDDYYPALCTESEYYQIRAIKDSKKVSQGNRKKNSILAGIKRLYCDCGFSVGAVHNASHSHEYYRCMRLPKACFNYIRQTNLDKMVLNEIKTHLFEPEPIDNKKLLELESLLELRIKKFKSLQAMILEDPELFGDTMKQGLKEQKDAIANLEDEIKQEQLNLASQTTQELSLESYDEWQQGITDYLSGDDTDKATVREKIQNLVKKITVKGQLIIIEMMDGKKKYLNYLPSRKQKSPKVRYYTSMKVVSQEDYDQIVEMQPEFKFLYATAATIDEACLYYKEDVPAQFLKKASPDKVEKDEKQEFIDTVLEKMPDLMPWKRNSVMKLGLTTTQWQMFKDIEIIKPFVDVLNIKYKTKSYVKREAVLIAKHHGQWNESDISQLLNASSFEIL